MQLTNIDQFYFESILKVSKSKEISAQSTEMKNNTDSALENKVPRESNDLNNDDGHACSLAHALGHIGKYNKYFTE